MEIPTAQLSPDVQKRNFRSVQIEGIGVSISNVAAPYLPVFLTRLGASNFQVGLLSSMPGVTGLLLAILTGRFLQTRKDIIPWYSLTRLLVIACYTLTGIAALVLSEQNAVIGTLVIWALATFPQTALAVAFSVVMNEVAGPEGRYALMSRRWFIFGVTGVIVTFLVTSAIDRVAFPQNYAIMFIVLSLGGVLSYYFSLQIKLPPRTPPALAPAQSAIDSARSYLTLLRENLPFVSAAVKQFVYLSAVTLTQPILPLFYVRVVNATDAEIGAFSMVMTIVMLGGYILWPRVSKARGGRFVLLATTLGLSSYPLLTALTPRPGWIILYSGIAGLFQAGLDLVFFDELMKTVPSEHGATFVALAQSIQYVTIIVAPLVGAWLADSIGLGGALMVGAGLRLFGFALFLLPDRRKVRAGFRKL